MIPIKLQKVTQKDLFSYDFRKDLMPVSCIYFGYAFTSSAERLNILEEDMKDIKEQCLEFIVKSIEEVQQRLPENATIFLALTSISPKEITQIQDLTKLAERLKNIWPDIDAVNKVLRQIRLTDVPEKLKDGPVKFLSHFKQYKDAAGEPRFNNVAQLALSLYSLPYSNAEVEQIFSRMNHLKNKMRNKKASPTTDALIRVDGSI